MIAAALRYFGIIFALGFVLGTIRTLWLAPIVGAVGAVLIELPIMLMASWLAARRLAAGPRGGKALAMGVLAFILLIMAEATLAVALAGQSLTQWANDLVRTPGWIGLAGQILFAFMPFLAASSGRSPQNQIS